MTQHQHPAQQPAAPTPGPTPGPWKVVPIPNSDRRIVYTRIDGPGAAPVGYVYDSPYKEANARLIAAAPTMYNYICQRASHGDTEAIRLLKEIGLATSQETTPRANGHVGQA